MTKFACNFIGHLGLCDSRVGASPIPRMAPSTLHPEKALLIVQSRHPRVRDQFQSILQIKSLRMTKITTIDTKCRS